MKTHYICDLFPHSTSSNYPFNIRVIAPKTTYFEVKDNKNTRNSYISYAIFNIIILFPYSPSETRPPTSAPRSAYFCFCSYQGLKPYFSLQLQHIFLKTFDNKKKHCIFATVNRKKTWCLKL